MSQMDPLLIIILIIAGLTFIIFVIPKTSEKDLKKYEKAKIKRAASGKKFVHEKISDGIDLVIGKFFKFSFMAGALALVVWLLSSIPSMFWIVFFAVLAALYVFNNAKGN
jgi:Flp pilus assembly protein TadB